MPWSLVKKKSHQKMKQYITFNFIIELKEKSDTQRRLVVLFITVTVIWCRLEY